MKKIFKLKKWLTLEETVRRLSSVAEEEISLADVLRLALDGHLTISVDFVNHAKGKLWERVPMELTRTLTSEVNEFPGTQLVGLQLNEKEVLQPAVVYGDQEPLVIQGVFDLTMWGAEKLDIEQLYQKLTDGPDVDLVNFEGPFLRGDDGQIYQILESFDQNEHSYGSLAHLKLLEDHIATEGMEPGAAKAIRAWHKEQRVHFLERAKLINKMDNYYPASGLPSGCRLVVRKEAITQLENHLLKDEPASVLPPEADELKSQWEASEMANHLSREELKEKHQAELKKLRDEGSKFLDKREQASMERLIFVLAKEAGFKLENLHSDETSIQASVARYGAKGPMGKGSIVKYLKAASARVERDCEEERQAQEKQGSSIACP
ncbi:hypothetical protein [Pseudomonas lini]